MASEWGEATVGAIASPARNALVGGPFGSNLVSADYADHGIPVIRGQNMGGRWVGGEFAYVTPEKAASLEANLARPGDIVFTQRGTLGQVSIVPAAPFDCYLISQSQMKLTVDRDKADPLFIYYVFHTPEQQEYIRQQAIQTGVPHTNLGILRDTPVPVPPPDQQRAIARILGTLDDKIEVNRRMNETLEAMARVIFKSWFVDFEPVRAKAEGRDPGLPKLLADLFPDSFEDTERGATPQGWRITSLAELFLGSDDCVLTGPFGTNLHASDYDETGVPLILVKHVNDGSISEGGLPRVKFEKAATLDRYRLRLGDIVFTRVGAVGRSAYVHPGQAGWMISGQLLRVRVPQHEVLSSRYLAQCYLQPEFIAMVEGHALGTTRPSLNTQILSTFRFLQPPGPLQSAFEQIVAPMDQRIQSNRAASETLAALRDALLPKVISGELRVKDTKQIVERAV